jgi:HAE1 family hydrophobic/amphiphilic exporter-1
MWFTRVSIANPVMAVMVMLAFVVLGLFSYQRLKVDQFPNIDFPHRGGADGLPRRLARDRRGRGHQEGRGGGQHRRRHQQLFSRSYEGSSVVIVQFNLDVDGRKAADDVREKVAWSSRCCARR